MRKLLYIDMDFHQKTKSTNFLQDILLKEYEVDVCYYSLFSQKLINCNYEKQYDVIVFFQIFPSYALRKKLNYKKIVYFPMYDGTFYLSNDEWKQLEDVLIVNFSSTLNHLHSQLGLESKYIQYFPEPRNVDDIGEEKSLFFWQRTNAINANYIKSICPMEKIDKITVHKAVDPRMYFVEPFEYDCEFDYTTWFSDISEMHKVLCKSALYFAPRKYEGIGMSFLEAMAFGRCVIAPDFPTMNEYITDGVNGLLYDFNNPQLLNLKNIRDIQKNAFEYIKKGNEEWNNNKFTILQWIDEFVPKNVKNEVNVLGLIESNRRQEGEAVKFTNYYLLMNKWLKIKNENHSLVEFFINNNVRKIAIYGYSEFAKRLYEELKNSEVEIAYFIDRDIRITEQGEFIAKSIQKEKSIDMLVITAIFNFEEIVKTIGDNNKFKIVSFDKVLDSIVL